MIPPELKQQLAQDPWYEKCAVTGYSPAQWHHCFMFAGKSIQEAWNIVPLKKEIHDKCTQHKPQYDRETAERVELIALERATDEELARYSKVDSLLVKRDFLRLRFLDETITNKQT